MTEKRFINDIDNGKLIDTKGELSTIHYSDVVDFYELWEFLNKLADENEQLRKQNQELIQGIQETAKISANGIAKPMVEKRWGKGVDYD